MQEKPEKRICDGIPCDCIGECAISGKYREKPDNIAHGQLTKAIADMEVEKIVGNISNYDHCRPKDVSDEAWTYAHRNYGGTKESCYMMTVAAYSYDRGRKVEPSESQEELMVEILNEHKRYFNSFEKNNTFLKRMLEKFTITRK